jgi:hypothetical protein
MPGGLYTIRVVGHLGATALEAFPEFESRMASSCTTLTGRLPDPAAVYDAVGRLEALGLEVIDLRCSDAEVRTPNPSHEES